MSQANRASLYHVEDLDNEIVLVNIYLFKSYTTYP